MKSKQFLIEENKYYERNDKKRLENSLIMNTSKGSYKLDKEQDWTHTTQLPSIDGVLLQQSQWNTLVALYMDKYYHVHFTEWEKKQKRDHWMEFCFSLVKVKTCVRCNKQQFLGLRGDRYCTRCKHFRSLKYNFSEQWLESNV